jgi:hypothetical protein
VNRIRYFAHLSVRRACGFAAIAIATVTVGVSALPLLAAKLAALLTTLLALVLAAKAHNAPRKPYRRTEMWLLLDCRHDLPEAYAQRVLMGVLRDVYIHFAEIAATVALALWGLAFLVWLLQPVR